MKQIVCDKCDQSVEIYGVFYFDDERKYVCKRCYQFWCQYMVGWGFYTIKKRKT